MSINDNILQAIQIVAENEVNKVSFDKTVVCKIIDDTNHEKGQYLVEENDVQYFAYCESTKYREGQQVYVLIPGGHYDNIQKTIISRYSAEDKEKPITYIAPFEQLVTLYADNIVPPHQASGLNFNEEGLRANDEVTIKKTYADFDTPDFDSKFCTTLGLKCDFKCLLQNYQIETGEYGLEFELYNEKYNSKIGGFTEKVKKRILKFSSEDILGNPFGFTSYISQQAKLNIQNLDFSIKHIKINFYQSNDFKDYNQEGLLPINNFNDYDIFVRNIELYYANDVSLIQNQTFQIYCNNLLYQMDGANNSKTIISKWYNIDENNRYLGYSDSDKYTIQWLHSVDGDWKPYNNIEIFEETKTVSLSKNSKREYIKAILKKGEAIFESNILTFENIDISEDPLAVDQIAALKIKLGNNAKYSHPFYNIDNTLDNPAQAFIERQLLLEVQCLSLNITSDNFLKEAKFYWYIPTKGTMLQFNDKFLAKKGFIKKETRSKKNNVICYKSNTYIPFYYLIKPIYSRNFIHNDITCVAVHNDISYKATIHFDFSSFGMNNSSYYLTIVPRAVEKKPGFIDGQNYELEALLFDANQEQVDLSKEKFIEWQHIDDKEEETSEDYLIDEKTKNFITINNYSKEKYNVYKVKVNVAANEDLKFVNLSCEYGLPWSSNENYCAITPTQIIYDSAGVNPKYYRDKCVLFDINSGEEIPNIEWKIKKYHLNEKEDKYLPYLKDNSLFAQKIYIHDLQTRISLCAYQGTEIVWEQPIIISQNTHSSKVLNEWNGDLDIDKDNNHILTAMLGAGRKNPLNEDTFDGILMGDIGKSQGDNNNIGLYGYNGGVQSFGFNIEGKAFLGKTGKGQIKFDGDLGTIESGSYTLSKGKEGMKIDLDNGHIDAFNFKLSAGNLLLNSEPPDGGNYFEIGKDDNMISLSKAGKLDIHSNRFTLEAGTKNSTDYLGLFSSYTGDALSINDSEKLKTWKIIAGNQFGVTQEGKVYAADVTLKGNINATSGKIGSWEIKNNYLLGSNKDNYTYIAAPGEIENDYVISVGKGPEISKHLFRIKADGSLYAHHNVDIEGKITATSGQIGNWFINNNYLVGNSGNNYTYLAAPGTLNDYVFSSGVGDNMENHNFWVKADGSFKATEGTIGNWKVENGYFKGSGYVLDESGNPKLDEGGNKQECYTFVSAPGVKGMGNHVLASGGGADLNLHPFQVMSDGSLIATRGRIGGWAMSDSKLYAEGEEGSIYLSAPNKNTTSPVINIAERSNNGSYFTVDGKGNMHAKNAVITGQVSADTFKMYDNGSWKTLTPTTIPDTRYNLPETVVSSCSEIGHVMTSGTIGQVYVEGKGPFTVTLAKGVRLLTGLTIKTSNISKATNKITYRCIGYTY